MADNQQTANLGNGWLSKVVYLIIPGFVAGLIAWGATQAEVRQHERRLDEMERVMSSRTASDLAVAERLARIETKLEILIQQRAEPIRAGGR